MPSRTTRPPGDKTGRELDGIDSAGGLEHEIESAADETPGLGDGVLLAHVDRGVGAEALGEAELLGTDAVRDQGTRRVQTRERDRKGPERPDPDHAYGLTGRGCPRSSPRRTHEASSTSTAAPNETASGRRWTT